MAEKIDLRVQKTHAALITAFLSLLERKRFEDITVNELCDQALVRRATFYKHFADKYDFFAFMVREIQQGFLARNSSAITGLDYYLYVIGSLFEFLEENQKLVRSVFKSSAFPILLDILSEEIYRDALTHLKEDQRAGIALTSRPEILARGFSGALIAIARWWVTEDTHLSRQEIADKCCAVLQQFM